MIFSYMHTQFASDIAGDRVATASLKVARDIRERALKSGLVVTTHKEGRLVQEKLIHGKLVELYSQMRE